MESGGTDSHANLTSADDFLSSPCKDDEEYLFGVSGIGGSFFVQQPAIIAGCLV